MQGGFVGATVFRQLEAGQPKLCDVEGAAVLAHFGVPVRRVWAMGVSDSECRMTEYK